MRVLFLACIAMLLLSCGNKSGGSGNSSINHSQQAAMMKFEEANADFGEVVQGEKVVLFYTFENVGGQDLIIKEAIPACGCTTPKFDASPVKPGEKRSVEVTFDSEGWQGMQHKSITFKTNGVPDYTTILLTGIVN